MTSIAINPYVQTNAAGSFNIETTGVIVGTAYPDPASRFYLSGESLKRRCSVSTCVRCLRRDEERV
jgi:hypothetical protein